MDSFANYKYRISSAISSQRSTFSRKNLTDAKQAKKGLSSALHDHWRDKEVPLLIAYC
jgi:hypothetical protein